MSKRLETLDLVRGILFLNMAAFHWQYISGFVRGSGTSLTTAEQVWQVLICAPFILLAGFCSGLSHKVARHGATILSAGLLITIGSLILMPEQTVWFGILTFLGAAYFSVFLLDAAVSRLPQRIFLAACAVLFVLCFPLRYGQSHAADYFPLIPWLFLFWSGRTVQRLWGNRLSATRGMHQSIPPLNFLGRHTLAGYLLHLPVLYAIAYLIYS